MDKDSIKIVEIITAAKLRGADISLPRCFAGTAAQMQASLQKLAVLPPETQVYCGHEYSVTNLTFAASAGAQSHA